jgi:pimeloyl-ACP methyl ester carboxylesterase
VESIRASGLEIAYRRAGTGPPLVLVHGAAEDSRIWRAQLTGLADELTVIAWDQPGAGASSGVPPGFGLAGYADALAALVEAVAPGGAHIGGVSWGGTVVLELYRRRPDLVATLILVDTYAGWKGSLPDHEVRARVDGLRRMPAGPSRLTIPGLFAGEPPAGIAALLEAMAGDVQPQTMQDQLLAMAHADLTDVLPGIAVPTLLVWGELDARSPLRVAREFERAIPDATLVVLPGAGHMSHVEQPERFSEVVRAFCRAHPPVSR